MTNTRNLQKVWPYLPRRLVRGKWNVICKSPSLSHRRLSKWSSELIYASTLNCLPVKEKLRFTVQSLMPSLPRSGFTAFPWS